jgi:hypothetical protein
MNRLFLTFLCIMALSVTGCVSTHYNWSGYEDSLYRQYKDPGEQAQMMETLKEIIEDSQKPGVRIPPGIYAEYAYLLYQSGKYAEAIVYFRKEHDTWPESRFFMTKMIRMTELKAGR